MSESRYVILQNSIHIFDSLRKRTLCDLAVDVLQPATANTWCVECQKKRDAEDFVISR